jgi:hypothetical protein
MLQCGEGDWICSAGTIIYRAKLGVEALRECYADFVASGIHTVRSTAIGHYALAIKHNNEISIFTDRQGALTLYYFDTESRWFVSNSLQVCARALPTRKIDTTKLLITALQACLPGEDTFYSGIKRLFGTQLIRIDLARETFRVERIPELAPTQSWNLLSMQDAVGQYKQDVRLVFKELAAVGSIGLLGTGGMDSRTVLAGLLDQQTPVQIMYGTGNSRLTDYDAGDFDVAQTMAKRYNLPFQQLNWSGNQPHSDEKFRESIATYGFQAEIYGASESFLRSFDGGMSPYPTLLLGGYSPAFSKAKPWELTQCEFTFRDLVADSMRFQGKNIEDSSCIANKADYRSVFTREVKAGLDWAGIDYPDTGASLETFVLAKLFLYIRAESRFLNLANEFGHYIAPFLMKRLYDPLLSVPPRYRANDEFQLRLIHALEPGLIEIPIYSGSLKTRIDRETFHCVRDRVKQRKSLARRIAKVVLPSSVRDSVRNLYFHSMQSGKELKGRDAEIIESYSRRIMSDPLGRRWFTSTSDFTPKDLARICLYLAAVNELGYSE